MMNVSVGIDHVKFKKKPEDDKEYYYTKRRASEHWGEYDLEELADYVGNRRHAFLPGHLVGGMRKENCTGMQIFGMDFDDGISYEEIRNRCVNWGIPFTFSYETLSSTAENMRFRIVFVHETLIEDMYVVYLVLHMLYKLFPESDQICKSPDRVFMGGKRLIEFNADARIALVNFLPPLTEVLARNKNYQRDIKNFCRQNRVLFTDDQPAMGDALYLSTLLENDAIKENSIVHKIVQSQFPSFFVLEDISKTKGVSARPDGKKKKFHSSNTSKVSIGFDINSTTPCELLNRFLSGEELDHNERFALATNLIQFKGGPTLFMKVLEEYYSQDTVDKWYRDLKYMKGYQPMACSESFCPYYEDGSCMSLGNIVKTLSCNRRVTRAKKNYCSLEEAQEAFQRNLIEATEANDNFIHLIKAQTALGKTESYTRLIARMKNRKFIIAVPTNDLKDEICDRLRRVGVSREDIYETPSLRDCHSMVDVDIRKKYMAYKDKGLHREAKKVLVDYLKKIKKEESESLALIQEVEGLLGNTEEMLKSRVIVTTHAKFLHLSSDVLKDRVCIIDEDILLKQIFGNTHCLSLASVEQIAKKEIPGYSGIAKTILSSQTEIYKKITPCSCIPLSEEMIQKNDLSFYGGDDINDIAKAGAFAILSEDGGKFVHYFTPEYLPKYKMIILSATLNEQIYRDYFSDRTVIMHPALDAKYEGKVVQFTYYSLGRSQMALKKDEVFKLAKSLILKADEMKDESEKKGSVRDRISRLKRKMYKTPETTADEKPAIITFKKFEEIEGCRKHGLHFGNVAGIDALKGVNMAVVGTPYEKEFFYKLIACYLGADVNTKEDKRPRLRRITYKGDEFLMVTYLDEKLREVQLYAISSELEQCIGRARALRFKCTVFVFSCFPCEQAEIHTVNYLMSDKIGDLEEEADKISASC
ncbi:MAG: DEAD/DEAH box helicase family protein [Lachnospiraceae bacterium]|nr:DEAD/DEAH box helicase family protein [Lachnospiraceae bacterium]